MSTRIALIGAGGKMGCRITDNFLKQSYDVDYVEVSETGLANLGARSVQAVPEDGAVAAADVVILAVPDVLMGEIAARVVSRMRPGSLLMTLDPAAPLDGQLPRRARRSATSSPTPAIPQCSTGNRRSRRFATSTAASPPNRLSCAR